MAYDANYWNSGQFMGNIPTEGPQVNQQGPQVNQPQINDTGQGWFDTAGIGDWYQNRMNTGNQGVNSWNIFQGYGNQGLGDEAIYPQQEDAYPPVDEEYQGPWSQEEYDERAIPRGMFGKPRGFGSGQGWFSRIGQGGGGFMGKFGTGEGWLASGAQRRAARRGEQYGADTINPELEEGQETQNKKQGFSFAGMGQGLMDLASQQGDSYEYNPFG